MPELENMYRVDSGVYIVRTQAGFKQALKRFLGESYSESKDDLAGYPTKYPSMVFLSMVYRGYFYPHATCIPLNKVRHVLDVADPLNGKEPPHD